MSRRHPATPSAHHPTVSVIVPCYNYGHYLPACVHSVLDQELVDVDILIIDDASPDGSGEVAEALARSNPRVSVIRHAANLGHIATYNEGLAVARGEYVVLLSADDMLTPGSLGRATALLEANPSLGMVYGHPVGFGAGDPPPARRQVRSWTIWTGREWIERRCRRAKNCIFSPEVVLRTSVQREIGGYRSDLPHSGDLEMWLRVASVSDIGRVNGCDQAYYRIHPASMQRTTFSGELADLRGRRDAFFTALCSNSMAVTDGADLYATATRGLAAAAVQAVARGSSSGPLAVDAIDELEAFALEVLPGPGRPAGWGALQRRRWVRRHLRSSVDLFAPWESAYVLRDKLEWRVWRWNGV